MPVVAKAFWARRQRVSRLMRPRLRSSSSARGPYSSGAVTTATSSKFLAAERMRAGPPMSMFSMISAKRASGLAAAFSKA
jgi:hypothetical protein